MFCTISAGANRDSRSGRGNHPAWTGALATILTVEYDDPAGKQVEEELLSLR